MVGIMEPAILPLEPVVQPLDKVAVPSRLQRVKRLERPSKAALDEQVAKVYENIDVLQGRIHEIKALIDSKQQNRYIASEEFIEARNKLSYLNGSFRVAVDEKRALREELDLADKMRERMRADARAVREKLPYVRVEQIDEEIKKLEYRHIHTSLTLQEENKLIQQIQDLTRSRNFVKDYNERMEKIMQDESSRAEILEKIREKDNQLNSMKSQQEEQKRILASIREKEASKVVDIPALVEERNTVFEKIKNLKEDLQQLKVEFRRKADDFWEREREWRAQQALDRKIKFEKRASERRERENFRKQKELENFVEPLTDEIILCEQLLSYLYKQAPVDEEVSAAPSSKADILAPKGFGNFVVCKKNRNDEELEGWFGGFGSKSKGKKPKGQTSTKSKEKERFSLPLDALASFQKLKLSPPLTIGDVPKSVDEVKAKKENYLKLQNVARIARENGVEQQEVEVEADFSEEGEEEPKEPNGFALVEEKEYETWPELIEQDSEVVNAEKVAEETEI
ncbi:hypothetical protein O6H91_Y140000 [Diphasiastrum complanatum]|nr:hypothetical protein O6H91_Y140000 [Diphasiastrum complanatum]